MSVLRDIEEVGGGGGCKNDFVARVEAKVVVMETESPSELCGPNVITDLINLMNAAPLKSTTDAI